MGDVANACGTIQSCSTLNWQDLVCEDPGTYTLSVPGNDLTSAVAFLEELGGGRGAVLAPVRANPQALRQNGSAAQPRTCIVRRRWSRCLYDPRPAQIRPGRTHMDQR